MSALIFLSVAACLLSLLLTPLCRQLFTYLKIVDIPDSTRKLHQRPIPRAGGIPIAASYLLSIGLFVFTSPQQSHPITHHSTIFWLLLPAVALIFVVGLIDDVVGLSPKQKLVAELVAATWACIAGVRITAVVDHPAAAWWAIPLSILWLVACTNAINLIDGLDGLASGVALFATAAALVAAVAQDNIGLALATAPLAGSLLGFLRYNFNPASIFLGDCGSLTVGFLLGCYAIIWCQKSATLLSMIAPLIALGLPLIDVGLSVGRRFLRNRPIFLADGGHIHHRLVARGLRPRDAALVLYAVCGMAAVLSLLQSFVYKDVGALVVVAFCGCAWFGIKALDYVEFRVAGQMVATGRFRRLLQDEICLKNLQQELKQAQSLGECWPLVRDACRDLGFQSVRLQSVDDAFEEELTDASHSAPWQFNVPLSDSRSLTLGCDYRRHESLPIISFIRILQSSVPLTSVRKESEPPGSAHVLTMSSATAINVVTSGPEHAV